MNEEMTASSLLRAAGRLIERALIQLDMRHDVCPGCHDTRYRNLDHKRIYDQFTNTPWKLDQAALLLEDPDASREAKRRRRDLKRELERGLRPGRQGASS